MESRDRMESRLCHARAQGAGGRQCHNYPLPGQLVCHMHGAKSPQALAKAEDRMRALVHPAVTALSNLIAENDLAASKYVLDWAGFKATEKVQQDGHVTLEIELVKRTLELPES